jgi:hypothetical protein
MTLAPGKHQDASKSRLTWRRDLRSDIKRLKETYNMDVLVSLMYVAFRASLLENRVDCFAGRGAPDFYTYPDRQDYEYSMHKISNLFDVCKEENIRVIHFPIIDGSIPDDVEQFEKLIGEIMHLITVEARYF